MCVGLTRAKSTLVMVGDGDMLGDHLLMLVY